jgi:serine/threonine protein kinase
LQDPHIVPVHSAGESGGLPFYTMPFVEGQSLRTRLLNGAVPFNEAVNILRDVALALEYAHAHGVVHRDIKPEERPARRTHGGGGGFRDRQGRQRGAHGRARGA